MATSENNNKQFDENSDKTGKKADSPNAHTNDPGAFSQRGQHVNRNTEEPAGGLRNDRETEEDEKKSEKGDSTQAGTQNSTSVRNEKETGAGSGNLTEENQARRTDKFGPSRNSDTIGI